MNGGLGVGALVGLVVVQDGGQLAARERRKMRWGLGFHWDVKEKKKHIIF